MKKKLFFFYSFILSLTLALIASSQVTLAWEELPTTIESSNQSEIVPFDSIETTDSLTEETTTEEITIEDSSIIATSEEGIPEETLLKDSRQTINKYITIIGSDGEIWLDETGKTTVSSVGFLHQTLKTKDYHTLKNGKKIYSLYSRYNDFVGYLKEDSNSVLSNNPQGALINYNDYVMISNKNYTLWSDFSFTEVENKTNFYNQTFLAKGFYSHFNGDLFYSIYDNNAVWKGYINAKDVTINNGKQGTPIKCNQYVTITKKNYSLWANFNWKEKNKSDKLLNKTFLAKVKYNHFNGSTYYSLYDNTGKWYGYINANGVKSAEGRQGVPITNKQYVTVTKKNYSLWSNFSWKEKNKSDKLLNKIFLAKVKYNHFNGFTYYSLYDNTGKWYGYINANGVNIIKNEQGAAIKYNKYVTISQKNYSLWSNFSWKEKNKSKDLLNQTFLAKVKYKHCNGSTYYSLYDKSGKWYGYINANGVKVAKGQQGVAINSNQYVTVSKSNYNIWSDFSWKKKNSSKNLLNQTFLAKVKYNHFNGSTYYSLYDNTGKWHGYINASGLKVANGQQGTGFASSKYVTIKSKNYKLWQNFSWKQKYLSSTFINQPFQVKRYYRHFNGSTYYSLYDNQGVWYGYINSKAVSEVSGNRLT